MPKQTTQPSGVVGGSMDISRSTVVDEPTLGPAGEALASRKQAGRRARKLSARRKSARKTTRRVR